MPNTSKNEKFNKLMRDKISTNNYIVYRIWMSGNVELVDIDNLGDISRFSFSPGGEVERYCLVHKNHHAHIEEMSKNLDLLDILNKYDEKERSSIEDSCDTYSAFVIPPYHIPFDSGRYDYYFNQPISVINIISMKPTMYATYPDNKGVPAVEFKLGMSQPMHWVFRSKSDRDECFERLTKTKSHN